METKIQIDFSYISMFLLNLNLFSLKPLIKLKEFVHFGLNVKLNSIVIKAPFHQTICINTRDTKNTKLI